MRAAADGVDDVEGHQAMAALYASYWRPVYLYCRRQGLSPADAEDLSQEFHAHLMSGRELAAADPDKGRFRSYLLTCLKHFLHNARRDASAQKRGGGRSIHSLASLPAVEVESAERWHQQQDSDLDPEKSFERAWALTLLDSVLGRLRVDYQGLGRGEVFDVLKPVLYGDRAARPYAELATQLGTTVGAIKVAVHKLRQRYGELLRREIAETVTSVEAVEDEIRALFRALG